MHAPKMFATAAGVVALSFALTGCGLGGATSSTDGGLGRGAPEDPTPSATTSTGPRAVEPGTAPSAATPSGPPSTADATSATTPPDPTPSRVAAPAATRVQQPTAAAGVTEPRRPRTVPTPVASPTDAGCPVTAGRLWDAFKRSPHHSNATSGVTDIDCHRGYATAVTVRRAPGDAVGVLFRYDATGRSWRTLGIGSSMDCAGVPTGIAAQLKHCFPG